VVVVVVVVEVGGKRGGFVSDDLIPSERYSKAGGLPLLERLPPWPPDCLTLCR